MSDYTGPGVYELIPGNATGRRVNVWGGGSTSGAQVKLYKYTQDAQNSLWEIVAAGGDAGNPEVGDRQYHIIGVESGLMLCAAKDGSDSTCTISTRSVRDGSSRWKIVPATNGSYYFISVLNTGKSLNVAGGQDADGASLITYNKTPDAVNTQFQIKRPSY